MRFCTSCQAQRSIEGGVMRKLRSTARWICSHCAAHKTESIYKSIRPMKQADLDRFLEYMGKA